jgi:rare lipoprotein A
MMRQRSLLSLAALAAMLAGCGGVTRLPPVADAGTPRASAPAQNLPALPPAGSGRGGYYQDDGPGEAPPPGLLDMPDPIPRAEPYSRTGNRPYVVFGKSYTPFTDGRPFKQRGHGSWYGKKFHGQRTSSGEIYDMYKMTAAHPTLPIPSYVRVTNVATGKQVVVRVNDRGPFHSGRIIDLSYTAALKLGYISRGSTELEVERILPDEIQRMASNPEPAAAQTVPVQPVQSVPAVQPAASTAQVVDRSTAEPVAVAANPNVSVSAVPVAQAAVPPGAAATPLASSGFYLQMGAYSQAANAEAARSRLVAGWGSLPVPSVVQTGAMYRVHSGPFSSRAEADAAAQQLRDKGIATPVVVQR